MFEHKRNRKSPTSNFEMSTYKEAVYDNHFLDFHRNNSQHGSSFTRPVDTVVAQATFLSRILILVFELNERKERNKYWKDRIWRDSNTTKTVGWRTRFTGC